MSEKQSLLNDIVGAVDDDSDKLLADDKPRRIAMFIFVCVVTQIFSGGIVQGWPGLQYILEVSEVFCTSIIYHFRLYSATGCIFYT